MCVNDVAIIDKGLSDGLKGDHSVFIQPGVAVIWKKAR